ncbi:hypothetical protein [Vibrio sp. B1Z05]|uniref:hypothetical protein n=1 Tax=Vibrio sp. B1Z05 TaxID=2654980 RepID=UPI001562130D|nr:hypothetical protein [Vibrio sp. B1Z05]
MFKINISNNLIQLEEDLQQAVDTLVDVISIIKEDLEDLHDGLDENDEADAQ